jgi:hypothetical protein
MKKQKEPSISSLEIAIYTAMVPLMPFKGARYIGESVGKVSEEKSAEKNRENKRKFWKGIKIGSSVALLELITYYTFIGYKFANEFNDCQSKIQLPTEGIESYLMKIQQVVDSIPLTTALLFPISCFAYNVLSESVIFYYKRKKSKQ